MKRLWIVALLLALLTACAAPADGTADQRAEEPSKTDQTPPATEETEKVEQANAGAYHVPVDWSQLAQEQEALEPVGEQWYDPLPEDLQPSDDYGPLMPYAGQRLYDDWPSQTGCLYGLMTEDGVAVTAPTYSSIERPSYNVPEALPLILLRRGEPGEDDYSVKGFYAVAALDGSWCTDFQYLAWVYAPDGVLLYDQETVSWMSLEGEILSRWTASDLGISQEAFDEMVDLKIYGAGWVGECYGDQLCVEADDEADRFVCYDLNTGVRTTMTLKELWAQETQPPYLEPESVVPDAMRLRDTWLGDTAPGLLEHTEYSETAKTITYYREDGTPLPELTKLAPRWYDRVSVVGGMIEVLELQTASYYDLETMQCRFRTSLHYLPE